MQAYRDYFAFFKKIIKIIPHFRASYPCSSKATIHDFVTK